MGLTIGGFRAAGARSGARGQLRPCGQPSLAGFSDLALKKKSGELTFEVVEDGPDYGIQIRADQAPMGNPLQ